MTYKIEEAKLALLVVRGHTLLFVTGHTLLFVRGHTFNEAVT
jgi:hypothetical protein